MAYNLGSVWLQVIPSFDGVQAAAAAQGRLAGQAFSQGFDSAENAADARRMARAAERGRKEGQAEGRGRNAALTAAQQREELQRQAHAQKMEAAEQRHAQAMARAAQRAEEQRATARDKVRTAQRGKDQEYWRQRQADDDAAQRRLLEIEEKARLASEQSQRAHQQRLERAERDHHQRRQRDADQAAYRLREQEQRAMVDMAKLRERDRQARERAEEAAQRRALQRRQRMVVDMLRRREVDPELFDQTFRERAGVARESMGRAEVQLEIDDTQARWTIREIQTRLDAMRDGRIDIQADPEGAIRAFVEVQAMIESLEAQEVDLPVDIKTGTALAELAALSTATRAMERDANRAAVAQQGMTDRAMGAANAFRAFNGVLLAAVTIGPLLIPLLASLAGGLAAVATAAIGAGAGIGAGLLAFSGVGDAVGAMGDLESERQYGMSPADLRRQNRQRRQRSRQVRDARRAVADARTGAEEGLTQALHRNEQAQRSLAQAERGLTRAREDAARQVRDAIERQERAERNLQRAQENARRAQENLTRARRDARREIEDLNNALISGTMSEQDALYDLEEARYSLFRIMQDGSATQRERDRAQLSYDMQVQQFRELQLQNERLAEDQAEAADAGVEGAESVTAAQRAIVDAEQAVADGHREVARAAENRARAEVDSVERVADAEYRLAEARRSASEAAEGIEKARIEGAEAVERAQERLADALADQRDAALDAAEGTGALATAQQNLKEALDNLSPAARNFAIWLFSLKPMLDELRWAAQEGFLPGLQSGMERAIDSYFPMLLDFVSRFSEAMGGHADAFGEWLVQPEVMEFFSLLGDYAIIFMDQFAQIMPEISEGLIGVMRQVLPWTETFGDFMIGLAEGFNEWANSERGQQMMADFFGYLERIGPEIWGLVGTMFSVLGKTLVGLAPHADTLIDLFDTFFGWLDEQDPEDLGRWARNLLVFVAGFQMLAGTVALIGGSAGLIRSLRDIFGLLRTVGGWFGLGSAGATRAAGTGAGAAIAAGGRRAATVIMRFGPIGLAIGAVILGLYLLYEHVEPFRDFVDGIVDTLVTAWEDYIWPTLQAMYDFIAEILGPIFEWLYYNVIQPAWDYIVLAFDIAWTAIEIVFKLFVAAVKGLGEVFEWVFENVIAPAWNWLYDHVIHPVWENAIRPVLSAMGNFISEHVAPVFQRGVEMLGDAWNWLRQLFATPIVWVVDNVINRGIIDTVNAVLRFFDINEVDHVNVPAGIRRAANGQFAQQRSLPRAARGLGRGSVHMAASGGILPGYTPGQDVHDFFSPTGGRLLLSGGEAIMRPEVTAVLGPDTIFALNNAAVMGGKQGVAKALGGREQRHFLGGMVDWVGNAASTAWGGITSAASWIGDIASYAWDFVTDPIGSLKTVIDRIVGAVTDFGQNSLAWQFISGVPKALVDMIGGAISSMLGFGGTDASMPFDPSGNVARVRGARPHVQWATGNIANAVGGVRTLQAINQSMAGGHPRGLAVDYIDDMDTLNAVAAYAASNARQLLVDYIAWQGRLFRPGIGWVPQTRGFGNDPMHRWHVHVEHLPAGSYGPAGGPERVLLRDEGGWLPHGMAALNMSGRDEYVLSPQETEAFRQIIQGDSTSTIIDIDVDRPGASAGEIAEEMLFALRRKKRGGAYV